MLFDPFLQLLLPVGGACHIGAVLKKHDPGRI